MNKERIALEKIANCKDEIKDENFSEYFVGIAQLALSTEVTEPRMFSEEEVIGFGIWLGEKYWFNLSTYKWECRNEEGLYEVLDSKRLIELYIQSLSPKEGKETDKEKLIRLSNGQVSNFYERAMQRKLEPNQTVSGYNGNVTLSDKAKKVLNNPELARSILNQTEAEKESDWEQFIIDQINQSYNEHKGSNEAVQDAAYYITKKIELNLSLVRKQVIEEIEEWVKDAIKNHTYSTYADLLTKLSQLKITK